MGHLVPSCSTFSRYQLVQGSCQAVWQNPDSDLNITHSLRSQAVGRNISDEGLTGAGLARNVDKEIAIRFAHETVFLAEFRSVSSAKINRRESGDAGKLIT